MCVCFSLRCGNVFDTFVYVVFLPLGVPPPFFVNEQEGLVPPFSFSKEPEGPDPALRNRNRFHHSLNIFRNCQSCYVDLSSATPLVPTHVLWISSFLDFHEYEEKIINDCSQVISFIIPVQEHFKKFHTLENKRLRNSENS